MNPNTALRRSQVYRFLADAFLYPDQENWTEKIPLVGGILHALSLSAPASASPSCTLNAASCPLPLTPCALHLAPCDLPSLQVEHRRAFGLTGSLCYETEIGLPNEFRQSQELADIAGFYRAFGFSMGGPVRERPDHLAAELEFMHILALKQALAAQRGQTEQAEICARAGRQFLQDHLGRWTGPLAESLVRSAGSGPYCALARLTAAFVAADAERLGAQPAPATLARSRPTPLDPDPSCAGCPVA